MQFKFDLISPTHHRRFCRNFVLILFNFICPILPPKFVAFLLKHSFDAAACIPVWPSFVAYLGGIPLWHRFVASGRGSGGNQWKGQSPRFNFSDVFQTGPHCLEKFGKVRKSSENFGNVWKRSETSGKHCKA